MSFNIRNAVMGNITGHTKSQLEDTITDALASGEEKMLPGLGVLFEVFWRNANQEQRNYVLSTLENGLLPQS